MEQRIDPNIQPEHAVGTDPAYVPGLIPRRPDGTEETDPEQAERLTPDGDGPDGDVPRDAPPERALAEEPDPGPEEETAPGTAEEGADGPVFEVSDRRASITADREGVRFRLDDQEAEFRWDEIGAVEVESARFGKRFTVTVHVSTRRWFYAEVDAAARSDLKEWTAELDAVLDVYFEGA
ncbi:hypothetical protein ACFWM0_10035 [Streptomyces sp. NPDC058405]|uniref:hypothetical protein n=1 Tax=unclassified Streptomyces TaxID=2593676 RepID=UPI00366A2212